jgi:nucleotide-binding universal stress UspA family protein
MYDIIVWSTDGSDGAEIALEEALQLRTLSGGSLVAVHCDQRLNGRAGGWPARADEDDVRLRVRRTVDDLKADGVDIDLVVRRSRHEAADVVAAVATELGADIIVCGTRGLGALAGVFLGSFTQRLLHVAPCPVLAVGGGHELRAAGDRATAAAAT